MVVASPGSIISMIGYNVTTEKAKMRIHIFRGTGRVFAFMERGSADNLPERYAPWTPFRTVEAVRGQAQRGFSVDDCLDDIARYGIHGTDAHVHISEQTVG
jgi:hypothetical protein